MTYLLLVLILLLITWFYAAYQNFKQAERDIVRYLKRREALIKIEDTTQDMREKTESFTERMRLQDDYQELHAYAMAYQEDKESMKIALRNEYLRYGFIYNLWRN